MVASRPQVHYDQEADVLYISLGKPVPSISKEDPEIEGLHYRYAIGTKNLSGATIVWYSLQDKDELRRRLPFPVRLP
jgi:hypothetical protein